MWHTAGGKHQQPLALGQRLQCNWSTCKECNTCVILTEGIRHYIPDAKDRIHEARAAIP